jgi:uridine kinase
MREAHDRPVDLLRDAIAAWSGRPLVIAIDGRSGAGKSTLARQVLAVVDAALVEGDLFYREMPHDQRAALTPEEAVANYFDWERLRDQALVPLRRGRGETDLMRRAPHRSWRCASLLGAVATARPSLAGDLRTLPLSKSL